MKNKEVIALLHKIYLAGYEHGDNQNQTGIYDAFRRLIEDESPLLDGTRYGIKDKVDELLSKF